MTVAWNFLYKSWILCASLNVILCVHMPSLMKTTRCLKEMSDQDEAVHYELTKVTSYGNDNVMCLKIVHYYGF